MAMTLVSLPISDGRKLLSSSHGDGDGGSSRFFHISTTSPPSITKRHPKPKFICLSISPPSSTDSDSLTEDSVNFPPSGCKACGREEIEKGCNGEGRIQGGIATVPGFGWWPIKAYRPCPAFVASGGRYSRRGQSMDEVAFGRGKSATTPPSLIDTDADDETRKKRRNPRRVKR